MSNPYASFCEDFYVNMRLGSQMALPHGRDTVLHFFEQVQKAFPAMTRFRRSENELSIEEDRSSSGYRWLTLESKRLSSGHVNPTGVEEAIKLHRSILQMAPHYVGISPVEIDYLDVLFGFDIEYNGNHDDIVAETMFRESPLACLTEEVGARPVDFQPTVTVALSDDCRLQARIDVVTRTNSYQVRTGEYNDDAISVYLILRRYWGDRPRTAMETLFEEMAERADTLTNQHILPRILRPLNEAIASRS